MAAHRCLHGRRPTGGSPAVDFTKATFRKVDLRGAGLGISAGHDSLRGAVIDTGQLIELAPAFAQVLGIVVSDI